MTVSSRARSRGVLDALAVRGHPSDGPALLPLTGLQSGAVVARIKAMDTPTSTQHPRRANRRPRYTRSRLSRWRAELVAQRQAGASLAELQQWLRSHRCPADRSTISRYLRTLPELTDGTCT